MTSTGITRRELCGGIGAAAVPSFAPSLAQALEPTSALAALAASKGITFGCQISSSFFSPNYLGLYRGAVRVVTPENDLKAWRVRPSADRYDYSGADRVVDFAASSKIGVHGHTLIWGNGKYNPPWIRDLPHDKVAEFIVQFIKTVVGRYRGKMYHWMVVNEIFAPVPNAIYRSSYWLDVLGPSYVDLAFRTAAVADPNALLVLNDTHLTADSSFNDQQRKKVLDQLRAYKASGTPIHALGIQAHIKTTEGLNSEKIRAFVRAVGDLGLKVMFTELDVLDNMLPYDIPSRDEAVAQLYYKTLTPALNEKAVDSVFTWGLVDKQSWYNAPNAGAAFRRSDGQPNRPLPLDDQYKRKPCWGALAEAFKPGALG